MKDPDVVKQMLSSFCSDSFAHVPLQPVPTSASPGDSSGETKGLSSSTPKAPADLAGLSGSDTSDISFFRGRRRSVLQQGEFGQTVSVSGGYQKLGCG